MRNGYERENNDSYCGTDGASRYGDRTVVVEEPRPRCAACGE